MARKRKAEPSWAPPEESALAAVGRLADEAAHQIEWLESEWSINDLLDDLPAKTRDAIGERIEKISHALNELREAHIDVGARIDELEHTERLARELSESVQDVERGIRDFPEALELARAA